MMAFFDDLQKNLSSVGKQAAEKAKDVADITVKTAQLHTEKQKLEECYARIGQRFYEATKDVPAEMDLVDFNEVEARLSAMKVLEDEIQQLRGKKPCPNCGEMVDKESNYCNHCGTSI
ncbi:MAG: zinc-ribbon domain-containing protein [Lachnospiraceae bacterium]|nr:zinc-ribbon domain-containing protein [Lachnospiraceae bacterium]